MIWRLAVRESLLQTIYLITYNKICNFYYMIWNKSCSKIKGKRAFKSSNTLINSRINFRLQVTSKCANLTLQRNQRVWDDFLSWDADKYLWKQLGAFRCPVPMLSFTHFLTIEVKDTYLIFLILAYNASDAVPNSELDTTLTGLW